MHTIYCISSVATNFFYLNVAEDYEICVSMHNKMLAKDKHPIRDLQKIYNQYGPNDIYYTALDDQIKEENKDSMVLAYRAAMTARN
jgi:hypothetical protein